MDPVVVVTLADEAYALPLAVMVRSLLDHLADGRALRILVIDGGILPATKQRLAQSWQDAKAAQHCEIEYVRPDCGSLDGIPAWGRVSPLTFARLSIAEYLPSESRKVVVLDSDTLVLTDIGQLVATDLDGMIVGATQDPFVPLVSSVGGLANHVALGLHPEARYFNAGVMLIDIPRWRAEHVGARALEFTRSHLAMLQQYDQDSLNAVLAGQWKVLDPRWQVQPRTMNSIGHLPVADPYIIHFSGRLKPWLYAGRDLADALFQEVVNRTAWRGVRPARTLRARVMALYDSPIRRVLYPSERRLLTWWQRWQRRQHT
jgi:lipopolysaccharide biosynthesis glycosyltransferase